jgi:DNA polymerase III subunit delta
MAHERGRTIEPKALNLLLELVGNNLQGIANAVEKLCLYTGENRQIIRADVEAVISPLRVESIFDLTDHIGNRNVVGSLTVLSHILQSGEAPLRILAMIARHFRMIMTVRSYLEQQMNPDEVRSHLKIRDFVWNKLSPQARAFTPVHLERSFQRLREADLSLKSQRVPGKIVLEELIAELCAL